MSVAHKGKPAHNKGISPTKETLQKRSKSLKGKLPSPKSGYGKRCYYTSPLQGQVCFRSSYELAYAKYLDSIHVLWMYEMETFDLGNTTYTPDFFLPRLEQFVEIKGYMNNKSQQKINMFNEQYTFNLKIIGLTELKELGLK